MTKDKTEVITVDIKPFIMPVTSIICSLIIGLSFMGGMLILSNGGAGSGTTVKRVEAGDVTPEPGSSLKLTDIAKAIDGVDVDAFEACTAARDTSEIAKDISDGTADGISGTPGFVIGTDDGKGKVTGVFVNGAQPYSAFEEVITAFVDGTSSKLNAETYPAATTSVDDDPFLGDSKQNVVIVEFSDYECPFCQRHHNETHPQIASNFIDTGKARYVFRDYPLSFHDPVATDAAVAANCIYDQIGSAGYFQFADIYFEKTKANGEGL